MRSASPLLQPGFAAIVLLLLAFVLYGNTLGHQYALDDAIVITQNRFTQEGFGGIGKIFSTDAFEAFFNAKKDLVAGGRYRPLSIATFAVEFQFFGLNPAVSHGVNVLLYGLLGVVVFYALRRLLREPATRPWTQSLSFLVALVFMAHPIHTEVVANIKGRDELLAMLFAMLALWAGLRYTVSRSPVDIAMVFGGIFLGALSKETALPFIALIPLGIWMLGKQDRQVLITATVPAIAGAAAYLVMRFSFAGGFGAGTSDEILNDPFLGASKMEQYATAAKTLVLYLGKLFVPATLSHDYYFNQVPVVGWSDPLALLGLFLAVGMGYLAVRGTVKRELWGYGLLFFGLSFSIVSNILLPIGTTMGERFVFVPSLGLILAVLAALQIALKSVSRDVPKALLYIGIGIALIFSVRTILRNPVWENDFVLFTTDVKNSPNSAKMQTAAGGALVDAALRPENAARKQELLNQAIPHLQEAVRIYPAHGTAWLILGNARFNSGNPAEALKAYQQVIAHRPGMVEGYKNAGIAAMRSNNFEAADGYFARFMQERPDSVSVLELRADNLEAWSKPQEALAMYEEVRKRAPNRPDVVGKIGMVYGKHLGDFAKAVDYLEQAIALNPKELMHHENVGIAYATSGQPQKAIEAFNRGLTFFPNNPKLLRNLGVTYINLGDSVTGKDFIRRSEGK
jgi:protein O-mannosyl-transferase